jgi:hypothetical protein
VADHSDHGDGGVVMTDRREEPRWSFVLGRLQGWLLMSRRAWWFGNRISDLRYVAWRWRERG